MSNVIKVAINGYGRIGRNVLRSLYENGYRDRIQVVAINDLGDASINAHLTKYDTVHGTFAEDVVLDGEDLFVAGDKIVVCSERDPKNLPWGDLDVDVVYECTGIFTSKEAASAHIEAGAKKVIVSAPASGVDATVVYGINDGVLTADHQIISNASCTTNCLAPIAKALNDTVGIETGLMTTVHAYTNDQQLTDVYHKDLRRARSATSSMIPAGTGAAKAIGLVLPELEGRLDGMAVRVPTINVSLVDLNFVAGRETSAEEINEILTKAADTSPVLDINTLPLVSIDFKHNAASSIADLTQTKVQGNLVKVMSWYDNEWGFSTRMLDNTIALMNA